MVEKSGVEVSDGLPGTAESRNRVMLRCARNIARWWQVEGHERIKGDGKISYPGEVTMQRGLMPIALWLGVREYGGIWKHGGGEGRFGDEEMMGTLGDGRMTAIADALSVYGLNTAAGTTLRPPWYRDRFVEWAEEMAKLPVLPDLQKHTSLLRSNWCGLRGCSYPYVTDRILAPTAQVPGRIVLKESIYPAHVYERMLYPKWGVTKRNEDEGQVEMEEEEEDVDRYDYSPVSE
jgi:hypothetical protein